MVAQMMMKVNAVFSDEYVDELARKTGFIKRKRKIKARSFLENLMFLRLEYPQSSLEDLVYEFHKNDTQLTKQVSVLTQFDGQFSTIIDGCTTS